MTWNDQQLKYGYVVTRLPDDSWWHMHFGRASIEYHCTLLGHFTNVFAIIQHFDPGCVSRSPMFILTLDGDGVRSDLETFKMDTQWSETDADRTDATHFQNKIMPLLHHGAKMQRAIAEIVNCGQHLNILTTDLLAAALRALGRGAVE